MMVETVEFLGKVDLFKYLDKNGLEQLATQMHLMSLPEGHVISESDPADGLYIIKSGVARVTKSGEGAAGEAVLAILRQGNCFGEIGLIDGLPRSASVVAMGPLECYFLPRDAFLAALKEHHEVCLSLLPALAGMVRNANQWVAQLL